MPVSGMAMDPCAKHGSKEGGNRDRSKPDSHITQRDAPTGRAHGAASAPIGKRRRHLIVRGEMHTRHTARRKHGSIVYGVRRRIVVADMGLVRGSPRPDHMAAEVRRIVLERAVRNSRERG